MSVKKPCIRQCCLDNNDICVGCYRSLQEILDWHTGDHIDKERIVNHAKMRKNRVNKANNTNTEHPKLP